MIVVVVQVRFGEYSNGDYYIPGSILLKDK